MELSQRCFLFLFTLLLSCNAFASDTIYFDGKSYAYDLVPAKNFDYLSDESGNLEIEQVIKKEFPANGPVHKGSATLWIRLKVKNTQAVPVGYYLNWVYEGTAYFFSDAIRYTTKKT